MGIPQFWIRHGRALGRIAALAIIAAAFGVLAARWYGTLRDSGRKTASCLADTIETSLGLAGISVEPNRPKTGDVSVSGTVNSQGDADALEALIGKWRESAWPSGIRMDVKVATHGKPASPDRLVPADAEPGR